MIFVARHIILEFTVKISRPTLRSARRFRALLPPSTA